MNKIIFLILIFAAALSSANAQNDSSKAITIGVELDALPYATGGYFAAAWAGKNKWRLRALTASVNKPDWSIAKEFSNHHVDAYAIILDRFLNADWNGWWIGGGLVYWKSHIQTNAHLQTSHFENFLLNGSIGYNWKFYKQFYLSPWAGMSIRTAGDKNVKVDDKTFTLPLLNPEASLKIGWYIQSHSK